MLILCSICSDVIRVTDVNCSTRCGHIFHFNCISQWISGVKNCPQCRAKVTTECLHRIYITLSNVSSSNDVEKLQSELEEAQLKLEEVENARKEMRGELTALTEKLKKKEEALDVSVKMLKCRDSDVYALKEQLEYLKIQNKETEKLKEENLILQQNLQTLQGLQKVLNSTSKEVEDMLKGYTDLRTVATFATALKRALRDSDLKKIQYHNQLTKTKSYYEQQTKATSALRAKYARLQESYQSLENKYEILNNKRKESEIDKSSFDESWPSAVKRPCPSTCNYKSPTASTGDLNEAIIINDCNTSFNTMVNEIEQAASPYLKLKQSNHALSALQKPTNHIIDGKLKPSEFALLNSMRNSAANSNSNGIFHRTEPVNMGFLEENVCAASVSDVSFEGLGGRSKPDVFPKHKTVNDRKLKSGVRKLTPKHKLNSQVNQNIKNAFDKCRRNCN